ncbi:energy transducer TonB [Lichenicoccus roseus]|nr:energy transducer TonB [Lichenicoccus roseus]
MAAPAAGVGPGRQRVRLFVPSAAWGGRRRREMLAGAGAIAVLFHVMMVGAIVEAPALIPRALRGAPPPPPPPPPEADIVMVKQDTPTVGGTPPPQKAPPPSPKAAPEQPKAGGGMQAMNAPDGPAVPPPAPSPDMQQGADKAGTASQVTPPPAPPAQMAQVNLDIDGQPGWGLVDQRTIPAKPDDHYINKPAAYPRAAGLRGEEGTVYLVTEVAPDGHASSVTIVQSSGYADLDRAARNAVASWHFQPAIQGGVPVASEMREAYHFSIDRNH